MLTLTATVDHAALQRILDALGEIDGPELRRILQDAVANDSLLKRVINYPDNRRAPQPFKSAASRRFFFAALRSGQISVPYQRTYALQRGWRYDAAGARVTNDTGYAAMVMGSKGEQSGYFAGKGWLSVDSIAQQSESQDAPWIAQGAVTLWIGKKGLG
jgi:hypothetical protein